jgi:carotenoid cleavage dioxygenase-like enzyme
MAPTIRNKGMSAAFHQLQPVATTFQAIPFDGGEPLSFTAPSPFTFVHLVNSYQNSTGIVIDMNVLTNAEPWIAMGDLHILRNKTRRDTNTKQEVWRYVLHLAGLQKGSVTQERLTKRGRGIEFPKINMQYSTTKHCIYYGQEWFHNDQDLGSMAVIKHDICQGTREYHYHPSRYPTEATFLARPGATTEDDGVLLFAETDGRTGGSNFVVVNATTMSTLVEQPIPVRMTFATHGEWTEGLIGRNRLPKELGATKAMSALIV